MSLSTKKFFPFYHPASAIATPVVGEIEFYILIHDTVKDNEYKNIYRNDPLNFMDYHQTVPPRNCILGRIQIFENTLSNLTALKRYFHV